MKPRPSLRGFPFFVCLLLRWPQPVTTQAETFQAFSSVERRYYHHEVHLDGNNHNDEFFSFVTRPDLDAPRWDIEVFDENAVTPGYWFSAPYSDVAQSNADAPWNAPHIYDRNGDLVWSGAPVFDGFTTFDFRVVNIQGKPMLSLVYPRGGKAIIFDEAYQINKTIDMGDEELRENEPALNVHEFATVENGTKALHLTRVPKKTSRKNSELVDFDGECFAIFDGIKESDTKTWDTTHTWNSEGHIGLDESYVTQEPISKRCAGEGPWDFFHANSTDTFPNGDYLLSGRRTNTVYRISRTNGSVIWRLGGRKSDFQVPLEFSGQHAATLYEQNDTQTVISFLDNAFLPPGDPQTTNHESRGLLLALDSNVMTAKLVSEFPHPEGKYVTSRGNMQMFSSQNAWICWSEGSLQSEHAFDGTLVMKARFKAKISSYRTFKFPWIGQPNYPPDVHAAVIEKNGEWYTIVHMSWNGATEVREWNVYHTTAEGTERSLVATMPRRGFETSAWTEGYGGYVIAEALDKDGVTLGVSNIFPSLPPPNRSQPALESSFHSEKESWLQTVVSNSLTIFIFGTFLGGLVGSLVPGMLKWPWPTRHGGRFAWWKQRKELYKPLIVEHDEEDVELEAFDDGVEIGNPKSKKGSMR